MSVKLEGGSVAGVIFLFGVAWIIKYPEHWVTALLVTVAGCCLCFVGGFVAAITFTALCVFVSDVSTETKSLDFFAIAGVVLLMAAIRLIEEGGEFEGISEEPNNILLRGALFAGSLIVALTLVDFGTSRPEILQTRSPTQIAPDFKTKSIAVALSGGGYRAVLMHAGVLDGLKAFGIPISSIASVSGGSIAAGYYSRGGDARKLVDIVASGKVNLTRQLIDLRNLPGLGLALPGNWRRQAQSAILDRFFLSGAYASNPELRKIPVIYGSTDLATGSLVGITADGFLSQRMTRAAVPSDFYANALRADRNAFKAKVWSDLRWVKTGPNQWPSSSKLSDIVAVSGGFPGAFEPLSQYNMMLVDGGVSDNSGITLLLDADIISRFCPSSDWAKDLKPWQSDLIISSNAGQSFSPSQSDIGALGGLQRSVELMYARTGVRPVYADDGLYNKYSPPAVSLDPSDLTLHQTARPSTVKTHFGWFPSEEEQRIQEERQLLEELAGLPTASDSIKVNIRFVGYRLSALSDDDQVLIMNFFLNQPELTEEDRRTIELSLPTGQAESPLDREKRMNGFQVWLTGKELPGDLKTFSNALTLDSNYKKTEAYQLYRLGWVLVALNIDVIRSEVKSPRRVPQADDSVCSSRQ